MFIFTDLDDSLFQTRSKCPEQDVLIDAAMDRHGKSLSYFSEAQRRLLDLLQQATLIPVTGRNTSALQRVHLSFTSYRITSHGAMVCNAAGEPVEEWLALNQAAYQTWRETMDMAMRWVERRIARDGLALRCRLLEDQGVPVYVSIKGDEAVLAQLATNIEKVWPKSPGQVHHNGHNMALLPPYANKERAVKYLMQQLRKTHANPLFIGLGDSLTDLPFMRLCHFAITPQASQIQQATWTCQPSSFLQQGE
jgi:hydroxymethylpyrimidine pyrophosphatase-like HAD family hydrolase